MEELTKIIITYFKSLCKKKNKKSLVPKHLGKRRTNESESRAMAREKVLTDIEFFFSSEDEFFDEVKNKKRKV